MFKLLAKDYPYRHDPLPQYQKVAIFGLGRSGLAAARLLSRFGKTILASDTAPESKRCDLEAKLPPGTQLILERNAIEDAEVIITSPGLEPSLPIFEEARSRGIPILAELELGYLASGAPLVAISGTDGKTTTTTLTSHILTKCSIRNLIGGNIGTPLCAWLDEDSPRTADIACHVVETSAFQLVFCPTFKPRLFIATNLAEDHVEYFNNDWKAYEQAKRSPLSRMTQDDVAILNASDACIRKWHWDTDAQCAWYASCRADIPETAKNYAWFEDGMIHIHYGGHKHRMLTNLPNLRGMHNTMNIMASVLAALFSGCDWSDIVQAVGSYTLPPHRIQKVCVKEGVTFIDDSKATNPHAAIAGLQTVDEPLVLIAGGVDKGLVLTEWIKCMKKNVRGLVLIGELTERLDREASACGLKCPILHCATLEEAVACSHGLATGLGASVVLLSPACSSYDMFKDYRHRGEVFSVAARKL